MTNEHPRMYRSDRLDGPAWVVEAEGVGVWFTDPDEAARWLQSLLVIAPKGKYDR